MATAGRAGSPPAKTHLYGLDPTTTLYTFLLVTDPSVKTVRLLGSWDNFAMAYAMERDARRDRGHWRGCHAFRDIICDGEAAPLGDRPPPRSGGLKMGHTYYYYYEVDGTTETHDPAMPSTTACPYLPGQQVNTLWVPVEATSRQRRASASSARRCDFRTMDPADKFVTPRPAAAVVGRALTPSASFSSLASVARQQQQQQQQPQTQTRTQPPPPPQSAPRRLLRHQRSLSPGPAALAAWSPRRLFVRRASPRREATSAGEDALTGDGDDDGEDEDQDGMPPQPRLVSSSSTASFSSSISSSLSSLARLRHAALAAPGRPAGRAPSASAASQEGSRSRDLSPESLRRFLVDDGGVGDEDGKGKEGEEGEDQDDNKNEEKDDAAAAAAAAAADESHDLDVIDDDEHNFATSAASESAPVTILSPPPSRTATPPMGRPVARPKAAVEEAVEEEEAVLPPTVPTRTPPAVPETRPRQPSLRLDVPPSVPPSVPSAPSAPSSALSLSLPSPLVPSDTADATDDEEEAGSPYGVYYGCAYDGFGAAAAAAPARSGHKADAQPSHHHHHHHHRHQLVAAALTGSTATLVPQADSGRGLSDLSALVDELGWMATAIEG